MAELTGEEKNEIKESLKKVSEELTTIKQELESKPIFTKEELLKIIAQLKRARTKLDENCQLLTELANSDK